MSLFEWKDQYVLGVADMDRDHKQLVDAMNKVHEVAEAGESREVIDAAIKDLLALTTAHFAAEEQHMEDIGFPDLTRHKFIHKDMLRRVGEHYAAFEAGDGTVDKAFFDFLVHWLAAHICHIDKKYTVVPEPAAK